MWLVAMFDLPVATAAEKRRYATFRKSLLDDGFHRLQYSVYARHCSSRENLEVHAGRIEASLPPDGEVRVLSVTEKQFERMSIFLGKIPGKRDRVPRQLELL